MKKFIKIIAYLFIVLLTLFLIDLYAFRGYYTSPIASKFRDTKKTDFETNNKKLSLQINKKNNLYIINFKNHSVKPFLVWTYRWKPTFKINDSIFSSHYRLKANFPKYKSEYHYGLGCGTGAGVFSINPFESFNSSLTQKQLLNSFYMGSYHEYNTKGDTINDLIHNKPLIVIKNRENTFKVFKRDDITEKDSINIQLYLPIHSYNHQNFSYIKSNYINLPYLEMVKQLINENKQVFKQVDN